MTKFVVIGLAVISAFAGTASAADLLINGAGATFPEPIYQEWFSQFKAANPSIQINYQAIGSGAGIKQLTEGTVDFGASDKFMSDEQLGKLKVKALHFPTVLGAVVLTYNLPELKAPLNLTGPAIAAIFMGDIKMWNDPKIAAANKGVTLPAKPIIVVHRSDGSGTSFVFTEYLSKVSADWKSKVGTNDAVNWPVGMGGKGTAGVAGLVKQNPYSIGYVELLYAKQNKLGYAKVENSSKQFIEASVESVTAAAAGVKMTDDFRVSITNGSGKTAYPISTYTWLLIPSKIEDAGKKKAITDFLTWMLKTGQKGASAKDYAPLPASVVASELKQIALIK